MIVRSNKEVARNIYEIVLEGEQVKEMKESGQFLHIKMKDPSLILRRPISIASIDEDSCTLLYKVVGKGTKDMSDYEAGDEIDVLGPLGNGFKLDFVYDGMEVLIIGGGIGVAPLYELGKRIKAKGAIPTFVLGFATKEEIYYHEEFKKLGNVVITTDDGSEGVHGHVGMGVNTLAILPDAVFACGPLPLNMYVQGRYHDLEHVYISLEERMACGIGACHACDTKKKDKRVCMDGPVFHKSEVEL